MHVILHSLYLPLTDVSHFPAKDETLLSVPGRCDLLEILTSSLLVFGIQSNV